MRPVKRGDAPRTYSKYQDAIGDLEDRLDRYCSYCERRFQVSLAVEHVVPKSVSKSRVRDWTNFLLGCTNCNSVKGKKRTNDFDFFWPDRDNTLRALKYSAGGIVEPSPNLNEEQKRKAQNLIDLVGLDRHPGQPPEKQPAERDKRYSDREMAWKLATLSHDALARNDNEDFRTLIANHAKSEGCFSIWMSVFSDEPDMRRRFIAALNGTALDCFDDDYVCRPRPGGQI